MLQSFRTAARQRPKTGGDTNQGLPPSAAKAVAHSRTVRRFPSSRRFATAGTGQLSFDAARPVTRQQQTQSSQLAGTVATVYSDLSTPRATQRCVDPCCPAPACGSALETNLSRWVIARAFPAKRSLLPLASKGSRTNRISTSEVWVPSESRRRPVGTCPGCFGRCEAPAPRPPARASGTRRPASRPATARRLPRHRRGALPVSSSQVAVSFARPCLAGLQGRRTRGMSLPPKSQAPRQPHASWTTIKSTQSGSPGFSTRARLRISSASGAGGSMSRAGRGASQPSRSGAIAGTACPQSRLGYVSSSLVSGAGHVDRRGSFCTRRP